MYTDYHAYTGREMQLHKDRPVDHSNMMIVVAQNADKQVFREIFDHYAPRVKAFILRQGCSADLAEDLMQETMLTVWQKADQFCSWRGSLSAWIFTIARNKRIDRFRKQSSAHYVDIDDCELTDPQDNSEVKLEAAQRDRMVRSMIDRLPIEQRQVILLSYVEEMSQSQISKALGIPLGTVKSRIRLAFGTIKKELEKVR